MYMAKTSTRRKAARTAAAKKRRENLRQSKSVLGGAICGVARRGESCLRRQNGGGAGDRRGSQALDNRINAKNGVRNIAAERLSIESVGQARKHDGGVGVKKKRNESHQSM